MEDEVVTVVVLLVPLRRLWRSVQTFTEDAVAVNFDQERDRQRALLDVDVVSVVAERHPVRPVGDSALMDQLELRFSEAVCLSDRLSVLTSNLEEQGLRYCVFGGWVRDTICDIRAMPVMGPPRDIDLVVRGIEVEGLLQNLPSDVRQTVFGGVQSNVGPIAFDIWPLHETFLIHYLGLAPTFESLLQSTDFTINAGLFFPRQGGEGAEILDGGMLNALITHTLAFNGTILPFPVMQCARMAAYAGKLSLDFAPEARAFMQDVIADPAKREQVLLGLSQNYPASISNRARQELKKLGKETR